MDLNQLFALHQMFLMCADAAPNAGAEGRHLALAGEYAQQIREMQLSAGVAVPFGVIA